MLHRFTTPTLFAIVLFSVIGVLFPFTALASVQVTTTKFNASISGAKRYIPIHGSSGSIGSSETSSLISTPMPLAGSFATLRVVTDYAPGGSDTAIVTLFKNAVATALTCTMTGAATTCSDITHSVAVVQGDKLTFEIAWSTTALHSTLSTAMNFTPTTANDTFLTTLANPLTTTSETYSVLSPTGSASTGQTAGRQIIFPETGTLDKLVASTTAPGASATWDFTVKQNAASTTLTCQVNGNSPNWCADNAHSISVATNDTVTIANMPNGSPAATSGGMGVRFVPIVSGDFNFFIASAGADSGSATTYHSINGYAAGTVLEASSTQVVNAMSIKTMAVVIDTAPTGVKTRVFTLDVNNTPTAATCTITGAATTCIWTAASTTPAISINDGDVLDTSDASTGTPGNANAAISLVANTSAPSSPTVTTQAASSVTATTATLNGNITAIGGFSPTVRGFAWGTNAVLSGGDTATTTDTAGQPFSAGAFTNTSLSFTCNTTYYARAYATNSMGDGLGSIQTFTTSACPVTAPTVTTQAASSLTKTSATLNGNITATGNASVTIRGFAWGTNSALSGGGTATTTDTAGQPFSTGAFTNTSLTFVCNTTYYARAYATNSMGDGLGSIQTFTQSCGPLPYFIPTRLSGVAPLAVFFDTASSTSASTTDIAVTSRPFHDLDYSWSFGDSGAGNWTYGTASTSKNAAYGPEAAHVFEPASGDYDPVTHTKTYSVTMTVKDGTNTAATTTTITVTDPNTVFSGTNTICFSTSGTFTSCPSGATQIATTTFDSAVRIYKGTNKRLLFRRGETYTTATTQSITVTGPGIIGAYGSGDPPKITATANVQILVMSSNRSPGISDWRIMDLEFDGQNGNTTTGVTSGGGINQVTLLRMNIHNMFMPVQFDAGILESYNVDVDPTKHGHTLYDQLAVVDSNIHDTVGGPGANGAYIAAMHFSFLGNRIDNTTLTEHGMRNPALIEAVVSNNSFSRAAVAKHELTIRGPEWAGNTIYPAGSYTENVVVSDNRFMGYNNAFTTQLAPEDPTSNEHLRNVIWERNWYTPGIGTTAAFEVEASNVSVRNNVFNLTGGAGWTGIISQYVNTAGAPAPNGLMVYNNTFYSSDISSYFVAVSLATGPTNPTIINNLAYSPNDSNHQMISNAGESGLVASHNSTDSQVLNTNPLFASTTPTYSLPSDFMLQVGSYALGAGTSTPPILGMLYDFARTLRQIPTSMGAFDLNPPTLTTGAVSNLAATTATLGGTITITGGVNSTARGIVYGTTSAYTATTTASGSFGTGAFTGSITGLTCNTLYHYAAYATNSIGTSYGSDATFTTSACAVEATPAPSLIAAPSPPQRSSPYPTVVPAPYPSGLSSVQVQAILSLLNSFGVDQATIVTVTTILTGSPNSSSSSAGTASGTFTFTRNLELHQTGADVLALQQYLNAHGFVIAQSGAGSPGHETTYFGMLTFRALVRFQAARGLPATGYFGPLTKKLIKSLLQ